MTARPRWYTTLICVQPPKMDRPVILLLLIYCRLIHAVDNEIITSAVTATDMPSVKFKDVDTPRSPGETTENSMGLSADNSEEFIQTSIKGSTEIKSLFATLFPIILSKSTTQDAGNCFIRGKNFFDGNVVPNYMPCHICYCVKSTVSCEQIKCAATLNSCQTIIPAGYCCPIFYHCDRISYSTKRTVDGNMLVSTRSTVQPLLIHSTALLALMKSMPQSIKSLPFLIKTTSPLTQSTPLSSEITTHATNQYAEISSETTSQPLEITSQTTETMSQLSEITSQSSDSTSQPPKTTSQPSGTTSQTSETTSQTSETTSQPSETTLQPSETSQPSETTSQPSETTSQPSETTSQPSETTSQPSETTSQPSETTSQPSETTSQPSETTSQPSETASQPSETASQSSETASQSSETASQSSETASQSSETASQSSETASQSSETASQSSETASQFSETTSQVTETMSLPSETTFQPTETVSGPIETTLQPSETTSQITETTSQVTETMSLPSETTFQPTETMSGPIETISQSTEPASQPTEPSSFASIFIPTSAEKSRPAPTSVIPSLVAIKQIGDCTVDGRSYFDGEIVPNEKPCEICFCSNTKIHCERIQCIPPVSGCRPNLAHDTCCPEAYHCSNSTPSQQLILDSSSDSMVLDLEGLVNKTIDGQDSKQVAIPWSSLFTAYCYIGGKLYPEGHVVPSQLLCHKCHCWNHRVVCEKIECAPLLDGCQPVMAPGRCCPVAYHCEYIEFHSANPASSTINNSNEASSHYTSMNKEDGIADTDSMKNVLPTEFSEEVKWIQ